MSQTNTRKFTKRALQGAPHTSFCQFLIDRGTPMRGSALPHNIIQMTSKECFRNSWSLATSGSLQYWEGFAWYPSETGTLPFHHAWCVDPIKMTVVDATWKGPEHAIYCGIHVPKPTLLEILNRTRVFGVFDQGNGFEHKVVEKYFDWSAPNNSRFGTNGSRWPTQRTMVEGGANGRIMPASLPLVLPS